MKIYFVKDFDLTIILTQQKYNKWSKNPTRIQHSNQTKIQHFPEKNPTKIKQKNPTGSVAVGCWVLQKTKQKTQHFVGLLGFLVGFFCWVADPSTSGHIFGAW